MNLCIILERELRVGSRDRTLHRGRFLAVLLGLGWITGFYALTKAFGGALLTESQSFSLLSSVVFVVCSFLGANQTADSISQERRDGTLGLLFLTPLRSWDLVVGKLAAKSWRSLYELLACFPILAVCFVCGGVSDAEFWKVMLNLILTLFFSCTIGLFVSSISYRARLAVSGASSLMLFITLLLPGLSELARRHSVHPNAVFILSFLSPAYSHQMAFDNLSGLSTNFFWLSLLKTFVAGWLIICLTAFVLKKTWRDENLFSPSKTLRRRFGCWRAPNVCARTKRSPLLDSNPFYWLATRERLAGLGIWILLASSLVLMTGVWWAYRSTSPDMVIAWMIAGCMVLVLHLVVSLAGAACLRLSEDRESGALELVLGTPLAVRAIIAGQWRALARDFGAPAILILLIAIVVFSLVPDREVQRGLGLVLTLILLELPALVWLGMWMALRARPAKSASAAAFWRIVLLPVGIWIVVIQFFSQSTLDRKFAIGFYLCIANSLFFCWAARRKLRNDFRRAVSDGPTGQKESWRFRLL
jgi:ABC-type transport system involved in multi-copper enzyme maturation permease subunit